MKFSIRDLFLLTLIVALAVGWWADRSRLAEDAKNGLEWKSRAEGLAYLVEEQGTEVMWLHDGVSIDPRKNDGLPNSYAHSPNPPKP